MAQIWVFNSFLILSIGKNWKFTLLPNLTCHQHRENKLSSAISIGRESWEKQRLTWNLLVLFLEHLDADLDFFYSILEPLDFISANPSVGWLMTFSLCNTWAWTPQIHFCNFCPVAWVPMILLYFSGVQPHLGVPQGNYIIICRYW